LEKQDRALAVVRVAIVIAVDEVRPDFAQVAWSDRLSAHHAQGLRARGSAIHQDEVHVLPRRSGGFVAATKLACRGDVIKRRGPTAISLNVF
jgi:hypothetical protein